MFPSRFFPFSMWQTDGHQWPHHHQDVRIQVRLLDDWPSGAWGWYTGMYGCTQSHSMDGNHFLIWYWMYSWEIAQTVCTISWLWIQVLVWILVFKQQFLLFNEKKGFVAKKKEANFPQVRYWKMNSVLNYRYRIRTCWWKCQTIASPSFEAGIINVALPAVDQTTMGCSQWQTQNLGFSPNSEVPVSCMAYLTVFQLIVLFFLRPACFLTCTKQQAKLWTSWWTEESV